MVERIERDDRPDITAQDAELVRVRARLARGGIAPHQLTPYENPDTERMVYPLDEPDTQAEIRRLLRDLWDGAL